MKDLNKEKVVEMILELRGNNVPEETIKKVLKLDIEPNEYISEYEKEKDIYNTKEAADFLRESFKDNKEMGVFNSHKIQRLVKSGELEPLDANPIKKVGYTFHIDKLKAYVHENLKTKEDLRKELQDLQEKLEEANRRIVELENKK